MDKIALEIWYSEVGIFLIKSDIDTEEEFICW